jgi:hypothetical protein
MKSLFVLLIAVGAGLHSDLAIARKSDLRSNRIQILDSVTGSCWTIVRILFAAEFLETTASAS